MDDDLTNLDALSPDAGPEDDPSVVPEVEELSPERLTARERIKRGIPILLLGEHDGIQYHWRDRLTVLARAIAAALLGVATMALGLKIAGVRDGALWSLRVAARSAIVNGLELLGATALYLLNHPGVTALVALLAAVLLWRGS